MSFNLISKNFYEFLLVPLFILFGLLGLAKSSWAVTYTICSSGCTATTFSGLFSAIDLEPDDVIEVQADTPGGSKTFIERVTPGSNDYGSAGHPLIIRVRAGDTIIIQGSGDTGYGSSGIYMVGAANGYITFDGFNLTNYGYSGVRLSGNSAASKLPGITIKNCTATTSVISVNTDTTQCYMASYTDGLVLENNTCNIADQVNNNQTDCFYFAGVSNTDINGNLCNDQNADGDGHNDGIQSQGGGGGSVPLGSTYNYTVRNNIFVHRGSHTDAKQLMYFEYETGGNNYIYNNVAYALSGGGGGSQMISVANKNNGTNGNFFVYNNTFRPTGNILAFVTDVYSPNITFKNNIVYSEQPNSGGTISIANTAGSSASNNLYYNINGSSEQWFRWGTTYYTFNQWNTNVEGGTAVWGDPLFISTSFYPYDLQVLSGSPAIDAGADISGAFVVDKVGTSRPQGSAWDIGAYEYIQASPPPDTTPPAPPSGVAVI